MLDPQMKQIIELYDSLNFPTLTETTSVAEVRTLMTQFSHNLLKTLQQEGEKIQDFFAPTVCGKVRIRGYYPEKKVESAPILFFRGSGFVIDNFEDSDEFCIRLAKETHKAVLSVDYPLAPESPYPASLEACLQVYLWAREHAEFANLDPSEMILIGESSGGCLVALLSALIRDRDLPSFKRQVLLYPLLNSNLSTSSYQKYGEGYILTLPKVKWYLKQYLAGCSEKQKQEAFPLKHHHFGGLVPTLIYGAQYDPLADDAKAYAKKLQDAKVPCNWHNHKGMIHGFIKFKGLKGPDSIFEKLLEELNSKAGPLVSKSPPPY